jgi:uncharacterized membrane protein YgcG
MNTFEQHETWLKSNGKEGKQCNLNGASLNSLNFKGRNLSRANLVNCDMSQCDLTACDMSQCDLRGTTLTGSKMAKVNLTDSNLTDATCRGANLQMAKFNNAICRGTDFFGADLRKSTIERAADIANANFSKALLDRSMIATIQEEPAARLDTPSMPDPLAGAENNAGLPGSSAGVGRGGNRGGGGGGNRGGNQGRGGNRGGGNRGGRRAAGEGEPAEDTVLRAGDGHVEIKPAPEGGVKTKAKKKKGKR